MVGAAMDLMDALFKALWIVYPNPGSS